MKTIDTLKRTGCNFCFASGTVLLVSLFGLTATASAQVYRPFPVGVQENAPPDSYVQRTPRYQEEPVRLVTESLIYIPLPEPKAYKVNDLVTVIVSEKSQVTLQSKFNRQRTAQLKAELKDFVRIGAGGNLENAASNSPTVDANLQGRVNTTGQVNESEGITYRITATVVDILPNGNLVLEARKSIQTNDDKWIYTLSGIIRHNDIQTNNTVLSENIASLQILKDQTGKTYASTQRSWGIKLYDFLWPF